jgi:hypothetical protein
MLALFAYVVWRNYLAFGLWNFNFLFPVAIFAFIVFSSGNMFFLKIKMTETQIFLNFGFLRRTFYLKNMLELQTADFDFKNYRSYGVKRGIDQSVGFIAAPGRGIKFRHRLDNRVYYFSTKNPDQIFNLLTNYGAAKA